MMYLRFISLRLSALIFGLLTVTGCATTDYAQGVNSFSQAVSQASTTEQTLAASEQKIIVSQYIKHHAGHNAVINYEKCKGNPGPYKVGDCIVEVQGESPSAIESLPTTSLTRYAALLTAVVSDKTCDSLQSDATNIASAVDDMAKFANQSELEKDSGPATKIAATTGCFIITKKQLAILRDATSHANPVIQELVTKIGKNDQQMYLSVLEDSIQDLISASTTYNKAQSASNLEKIVSLSQAVDNAQSTQPGLLLSKLAVLHQKLMDDLASPTVSLKDVENDAAAFIVDAKTIDSAVQQLASSKTIVASAKKQ